MTLLEAIRAKFKGVPNVNGGLASARSALKDKCCLVCGSSLLLPLTREPISDWRVHCNHCGTEMPLAVLLNQEAWRRTIP